MSDDIDDRNETWWRGEKEPKFEVGDKVVCRTREPEWFRMFTPVPEPGRVYVIETVYDDGTFGLVGIWSHIDPAGYVWVFKERYFELLSEVRESFRDLRKKGHPALAPKPTPRPRKRSSRKKASK